MWKRSKINKKEAGFGQYFKQIMVVKDSCNILYLKKYAARVLVDSIFINVGHRSDVYVNDLQSTLFNIFREKI